MLMLIGIVVPAGQSAQAAKDNSNIVISQVYGGGGNSGALFKNDFIELYNPTDSAVSLEGWEVRYASATGAFNNVATLSGTIKAGGYLLIQQKAGTGGNGADLPAPDLTGSLDFSGTNGKVNLIDGSENVIDFVGYGTANSSETLPTPALSNSTAAIRLALTGAPAGNRGLDTDNNAADFVVRTPDPRNSSYGLTQAVEAVTANPAANAWPAGTAISLNSSAVGASVYAAVYIDGAGAEFKPYSGQILLNVPTTIKTYASVSDSVYSSTSTYNYTILTKTDIASARLAPKGQNVWTEGVVTRIDGPKMYIQDATAAIVLYGFPAFAEVGDLVEVQGTMDIYNNLQELKPAAGLEYKVITETIGIPAAKLITAADLTAANGEAHEAQLVTLTDVTIDSKEGTTVIASQGNQTFTIYSGLSQLTAGKHFDRITGVIEQFNTVYQFIPLSAESLVEELFSVTASPGAGRIIIGSSVALSSPTAEAEVYYTIDGSEPTISSMLYTAPILITADTVIKAIASSQGQTSKVYTFEYVASELPRIHDIQGESHISDYAGQTVKDVEGIVTEYGYTFANGNYKGFFIQDPEPDDNDSTSEGIFVYSTNTSLKPDIGDHVSVSGLVSEYNEGSSSNMTSTQITLNTINTIAKEADLPEPVVLGKGGRAIPSSVIDNDGLTVFQPTEDAIDFYESLEGMLVTLPTPTIISPYWTSGGGTSIVYNIPARVDNAAEDVITAAGGLVLKGADNLNPQRLLIAYGDPGQEVGTGDKFNGDVTGVIGYNNGNYKVIPANGSLPSITPSSFTQETSTITVDEEKLLIASYNIENYYPGVGATKIQKLAQSITVNLKKPDIISVVEMQDSDGETNNGTVEASAAELIQAIQTAGGPAYNYIDIAPVNNADGGAPGGNIRVGFLYNPARVKLSDSINGQKGSAIQSVSYNAEADELTYNPGRIAPTNDAFANSRKPLAAQFEFNGEKVIVIANHFNSKSGDNGPFGNVQPPVLSSEVQRHKIAAVVNGFVKDVLAANPSANIVALGDLNDFQFTKTAAILKGNELDNLIEKLPLNEQYTYTYDGNSQVLDHILTSKNIANSAKVDVVHLNADFPESRGRVSDHDPVVAQFDLTNFDLRVLHTNDTHGHLETIAKRTTAIKQERNSHTLLLDAGDVFSGTLYSTTFKGMADVDFMNDIGYDVMTFGNHEFDQNKEHPEILKNFVEAAAFPFASSNIDFTTKNSELAELYHDDIVTIAQGDTAYNGNIYPAVIKDVYGEKVGIFGLTTEDTVGLSSPGDKISFKDHVQSAKNTVAMLEAKGVNKIIAVTHLGYTVDKDLAAAVPGIDIIVGGHSHTKIDNPPEPVTNVGTGKPVLVVQTGEYSQYLGELDVTFDKNGEIVSYNGKLLEVAKYAEDPEAKAKLASKYDSELSAVRAEKVGYSNVDLYTNRTIDGKSVRVVRQEETPIGNMIADSIAEKVTELMPNFVPKTELDTIKGVIAIQNGGGIRAAIDKGDITMGEVLTTLPFNNSLVALKVTGEEIISSLENSVSGLSSDQGRFAQVSGMKYTYDSTKTPEIVDPLTGMVTQAGNRVVSVDIKQADGSYLPIDPKAYYILSTNSFMAGGGDFYRALASAKADGRYYELGLPDFEVLLAYLKKHNPVTSSVEGRITDLKGASTPDEDFSLRVLHTNDTHSHLETVVKRMTAIKQERTGNSLLIDAGDVFSGTLYFTKFEGLADLEFMNYIGYDAMTFGNHEFDKGLPTLRSFINKAEFPFISSNIDFTTKNNELKDIFVDKVGGSDTATPVEDGHIYPSVIKEVYGEKIGIFGLTTEDTVGLSSPGENISFQDYKTSAESTVKSLQALGINKIIAVSHLGYNVDQKLAVEVAGIDIIVGGHSHTKLDSPVLVNADTEPTLIVQTGEYGTYLGELDVNFDDEGIITTYNGKLIDTTVYAEDLKAKEMLAGYDAKLTEIRQTVVGESTVPLVYERMINGKLTRVVRNEETNLGNLIADGINVKAKELVSKLIPESELSTIKGFVAIQNGGGIRAGINQGTITLGEVLTVMPFSNSLVALKVTGQEIIDSLENGVSGLENDQGRFAQVSGMRYTYDSTKTAEIINPTTNVLQQEGQRIISVDIKQADGSYTAVDPNAYYILSTNSFMAGGGDFYRSLAKAKADGRYYELYLPDYEVFTDYLDKLKIVNIGIEGRITDLKGAAPTPTPTPAPTAGSGGGPGTTVPTATPSPSPTATATAAVPPQVTTITAADLTAQLAALPAGTSELIIPLTASGGGAQVVLPGSVLVQQAAAKPNTVLTFTSTGGASYSLPLSLINGTALAAQLGTSDFTVTVSLLQADTSTLDSLNKAIAAQAGSVTLAAPVIEFSVTAEAGNTSVPLNSFGSTYVKRTITATGALSSQGATAVSYDPATGKLSFVPSIFAGISDGDTEVTIKRNSNSYYTVVKSTKTFGDTTGHWAQSSIELLASKLIITGTSSTAFSPSLSITRAEFAALITRSLGLASASGGTTFRDVSTGAWYADAVQTAAAAGLITGYTDGSFKPGNPISRQEMAAVLSKAIKYTGKTLTADPAVLAKFSDAAGIPDWSRAAVAEIAAEGIIQGTPDGAFAPAKLATRAEAATMLEKTLKSLQFIN